MSAQGGRGLAPWVFLLIGVLAAGIAVTGCPLHAQKQLAQCLELVVPFLNRPVPPALHTCRTIKTFIHCVSKKKQECRQYLESRKVLKIAEDLKIRYCVPELALTTTTTTPPPTVHEMFDSCRHEFKSSSHRSLRQACQAAYRFVECGQSVLWSHDFSLETFQLHAELMRNRAVFWQHCRRRALLRGGVGLGMCPYDVTAKLASCLNITYWQPVVPGDVKTFCRVGVEIVPCLGELANGCHHVATLQSIADFMWSSFQLLSGQCSQLSRDHAYMMYDYRDYDAEEDTSPKPVAELTTARHKAKYRKPTTSAPHLQTAKPPIKLTPEPGVSKIKSSKQEPEEDDKKVLQEKPNPDAVAEKEKASKNEMAESVQEVEEAEEGFAKDNHGMDVSVPSSDEKTPTETPPSKAAVKSGRNESGCNDEDEKESAEIPGKEDVPSKQGVVLPCNSSNHHHNKTKQASMKSDKAKLASKMPPKYKVQDQEQTNRTKEQSLTNSSHIRHTTLPSSKPNLQMLSDESSSNSLPTTLTILMTTGLPSRFPEDQSVSDKSSQAYWSSTQTPVQSTVTHNSTSPRQAAENTTYAHADVKTNQNFNGLNDSKLKPGEEEGEEGREEGEEEKEEASLENELYGMKTTAASPIQAASPTNISLVHSSAQAQHPDEHSEQDGQQHIMMSSDRVKGEEEIIDAYKTTSHSPLNNSEKSQSSATVKQNMTRIAFEITTVNATFQDSDDNESQEVLDDSEEEYQENKNNLTVKPRKLENETSSEIPSISPSSTQSKQNSDGAQVYSSEDRRPTPPLNLPQSTHSPKLSNASVGKEKLNTSHTQPTSQNSTESPTTKPTLKLFTVSTTAVTPGNATHNPHQGNESLQPEDLDQAPGEEFPPKESSANDSDSESRQETQLGNMNGNATDFNISEAKAQVESLIFRQLNLTLPRENDSLVQGKTTVSPQGINEPNSDQEEKDLGQKNKIKSNQTKQLPPERNSTTMDTPNTTPVTNSQTSQYTTQNDQTTPEVEPNTTEQLTEVTETDTSAGKRPEVQKRPEMRKQPEAEDEQQPQTSTPDASEVPEAKNEGAEDGSPKGGKAGGVARPRKENRCTQPWQKHNLCTVIIMRARMASSHQGVCRSLRQYLDCLNQLLEDCHEFSPFESIGNTVDYVTDVFHHKCPEMVGEREDPIP